MIPDLEEMAVGQHVHDFPNDHFPSDQEERILEDLLKKPKSQDRNPTSARFVKNMTETKKEDQEMIADQNALRLDPNQHSVVSHHLDDQPGLHSAVREETTQDHHVHDFPNDHFPKAREGTIRDLRLVQLLLDTKDHFVGFERNIN